ncbi:MAG TPA: AraC family transcriptional regulator [Thermoanaerobaculia bacterium]|nr:AraC family transcriptional regulator [Thermoanaerobaculia bacterium]
MGEVLINPRAGELGRTNAILSGHGRVYDHRFAGPLSLKAVMRGSATWTTDRGRYEFGPGAVLLLEDGEEYEIEIHSLHPVETFCVFFARGFVEDALQSATNGSAALLDDAPVHASFAARMHFDAALVGVLTRAHQLFSAGEPLGESLYEISSQLVRVQHDIDARVAQLPALRASTREELRRRLAIATAFMHGNLEQPLAIADVAREACLSPFHFHRLFTALHGVPPHRYLTHLRLERARALLRAGDRAVAGVAFATGFESIGSFTTLFRKHFGITPGRFSQEWRSRAASAGVDFDA